MIDDMHGDRCSWWSLLRCFSYFISFVTSTSFEVIDVCVMCGSVIDVLILCVGLLLHCSICDL